MDPKFAVITLWVEDVVKVADFYRDGLGLRLLSHHDGSFHFDVNGVYLAIRKGRAISIEAYESSRFPLFAIAVDDLEKRVDQLEKLNIVFPWGIESNANSRWIMFNDPAGNLIELVQFYEQLKNKRLSNGEPFVFRGR
jgi:catechol-2,3-dioxygenase